MALCRRLTFAWQRCRLERTYSSTAVQSVAVPVGRSHARVALPLRRWPCSRNVRPHGCTMPAEPADRRCVATVAEVLLRKPSSTDFVISATAPLSEAIARIARTHTLALVVVEGPARKVVGIITARDLLRGVDRELEAGADVATLRARPVSSVMTPNASIVHTHTHDTLAQCALLMSECKDLSNLSVESDRGGKASFLSRVLPRRGLSPGITAGRGTEKPALAPLFCRTGVAGAPRASARVSAVPHKTEDACFVLHTLWPHIHTHTHPAGHAHGHGHGASPSSSSRISPASPSLPSAVGGHVVTYLGIADGVGSWSDVSVDPSKYARRLMEAAARVVWERAVKREAPPTTLEVLVAAWEAVSAEKVVGSATASILSLDCTQNQLSITGVGDCGVILLRDTDIDRVGTLLRGGTASGIRAGWRVSARATQQMRGFNMPYQLGYAPGQEDKFEKPWQGETLTLPVHAEDIIIAASDGLYDNLDETDILAVVEDWDKADIERRRAQQIEERRRGRVLAGTAPAARPSEAVPKPPPYIVDGRSTGADTLAHALVDKALEFSLDRMRDGPFARLAKENDVMWTRGGRPDDTTVIVARVSRKESVQPMVSASATCEADVSADVIKGVQH